MTIYIDNDFKCYTTSADGRRGVETNAFDGKCRQYIEGYCFVSPDGEYGQGKMGGSNYYLNSKT